MNSSMMIERFEFQIYKNFYKRGNIQMKVRNGMLEKLERASEYSKNYRMLIGIMYKYYLMADMEYDSNRHQIFESLYIKKKSNQWVMLEHNISAATLNRYIHKFEELAKKIIENNNEFEPYRDLLDL
jgi:hypothetical protein